MYAVHAVAATSAKKTPSGSSAVRCNPSSATPTAASATHNRSTARREPRRATVSGPRNSIVTATPSGIRANAS